MAEAYSFRTSAEPPPVAAEVALAADEAEELEHMLEASPRKHALEAEVEEEEEEEWSSIVVSPQSEASAGRTAAGTAMEAAARAAAREAVKTEAAARAATEAAARAAAKGVSPQSPLSPPSPLATARGLSAWRHLESPPMHTPPVAPPRSRESAPVPDTAGEGSEGEAEGEVVAEEEEEEVGGDEEEGEVVAEEEEGSLVVLTPRTGGNGKVSHSRWDEVHSPPPALPSAANSRLRIWSVRGRAGSYSGASLGGVAKEELLRDRLLNCARLVQWELDSLGPVKRRDEEGYRWGRDEEGYRWGRDEEGYDSLGPVKRRDEEGYR